MTGARGKIGDHSATELAALRASESGRLGERFADEPVARLDEFVELLLTHPTGEAFVELKSESIEVFGVHAVLDAVLPVLEPLGRRCRLISFHLGVLREASQRCDFEFGPVLERWKDRSSSKVIDLEPDVIFCNVRRLPSKEWLAPPIGNLAVYEIDEPERARSLLQRGATWIETFAIGEMLEALSTPLEDAP